MAQLSPEVQAKIDAAKARQVKIAEARRVFTPEEIVAALGSIPTLVESKDDDYEHTLIYGEPGSGKTILAGLLSEFYNILWFDGEKGAKTLYENLPKELMERIRIIRVQDTSLTPNFVATMLKIVTGRQVKLCLEHGVVDCPGCQAELVTVGLNYLPSNYLMVMDSLTQFSLSALNLSYYKVTKDTSNDVDEYWRGEKGEMFAYWGGLKNVLDKFGNYLKDLQCNCVVISHEMNPKESSDVVPVAGSEPSSISFAKFVGTLINCKLENNRHKYISSETSSTFIQAKSRSNVNLEKVTVPSLLHVFRPKEAAELLKGSYNEWYLTGDKSKPAPTPKKILT